MHAFRHLRPKHRFFPYLSCVTGSFAAPGDASLDVSALVCAGTSLILPVRTNCLRVNASEPRGALAVPDAVLHPVALGALEQLVRARPRA